VILLLLAIGSIITKGKTLEIKTLPKKMLKIYKNSKITLAMSMVDNHCTNYKPFNKYSFPQPKPLILTSTNSINKQQFTNNEHKLPQRQLLAIMLLRLSCNYI
jgi:hypothetical protein